MRVPVGDRVFCRDPFKFIDLQPGVPWYQSTSDGHAHPGMHIELDATKEYWECRQDIPSLLSDQLSFPPIRLRCFEEKIIIF